MCACGNLYCSISIRAAWRWWKLNCEGVEKGFFLRGSCMASVQRKNCLKLLLTSDLKELLSAVLTWMICAHRLQHWLPSQKGHCEHLHRARGQTCLRYLRISTNCASVFIDYFALCFLLPETSLPACVAASPFSFRSLLVSLHISCDSGARQHALGFPVSPVSPLLHSPPLNTLSSGAQPSAGL